LSHQFAEGPSARHPQCLELVDSETKLHKFLYQHEHELHKVHVILFHCELPLKAAKAA
jgi:hypothetical protein